MNLSRVYGLAVPRQPVGSAESRFSQRNLSVSVAQWLVGSAELSNRRDAQTPSFAHRKSHHTNFASGDVRRFIERYTLASMISVEELVAEEWAEWYRMTPLERWRESEKLWQ